MSVRKGTEDFFMDAITNLTKAGRWKGVFEDYFYPRVVALALEKKAIVAARKPLVPGTIYIKMKMDPDIVDDFEDISIFKKKLNYFMKDEVAAR